MPFSTLAGWSLIAVHSTAGLTTVHIASSSSFLITLTQSCSQVPSHPAMHPQLLRAALQHPGLQILVLNNRHQACPHRKQVHHLGYHEDSLAPMSCAGTRATHLSSAATGALAVAPLTAPVLAAGFAFLT